MSKTARQAERVTGHPPGMLQDDSRELTAWLAGKPDAMRHARDAVATIRAERVSAADELCQECGGRGWHKLSCSQRTDSVPQYPATRDAGGVVTVCQRDHVEDLRAMVPCAVCAVGHATLQRDASGYYRACEACGSDYAGTDELALRRSHVVDADKMVRPCRGGQEENENE